MPGNMAGCQVGIGTAFSSGFTSKVTRIGIASRKARAKIKRPPNNGLGVKSGNDSEERCRREFDIDITRPPGLVGRMGDGLTPPLADSLAAMSRMAWMFEYQQPGAA